MTQVRITSYFISRLQNCMLFRTGKRNLLAQSFQVQFHKLFYVAKTKLHWERSSTHTKINFSLERLITLRFIWLGKGSLFRISMKPRESRADHSKASNPDYGYVIFNSSKNRIEVIPPKIVHRRCRSETPSSTARGRLPSQNAAKETGPGRYVKRGHA